MQHSDITLPPQSKREQPQTTQVQSVAQNHEIKEGIDVLGLECNEDILMRSQTENNWSQNALIPEAKNMQSVCQQANVEPKISDNVGDQIVYINSYQPSTQVQKQDKVLNNQGSQDEPGPCDTNSSLADTLKPRLQGQNKAKQISSVVFHNSENQIQIKNHEQTVTNYKLKNIVGSQEDSLMCSEQYNEHVSTQVLQNTHTQRQSNQKQSPIELVQKENKPQPSHEIRQGAKNLQQTVAQQQQMESPFQRYASLGNAMDMYPQQQRQDNGSNLDNAGGFGFNLVSPIHCQNMNQGTKKNAVDVQTLILASKQFSFAPSQLGIVKSPIDARLQSRIQTKHFDSPEQASKYEYHNTQNHSGNKRSGSFLESQMIAQTMMNIKNESSPLRKLNSKITESPFANRTIRTPAKRRSYSPSQQIQTCQKDEAGMNSEIDHLNSSNTTQKYRTKTTLGSIIHSNFKINQNSLPKSSKNLAISSKMIEQRHHHHEPDSTAHEQAHQNSGAANQNAFLSKSLSFSGKSQVVFGRTEGQAQQQQPTTAAANTSTNHQNAGNSINKRLQYGNAGSVHQVFNNFNQVDSHHNMIQGYNNNNQTNGFNSYNYNVIPPSLSTGKFAQQNIGNSSLFDIGATTNSPAFPNPLLSFNVTQKQSHTHSKSSKRRVNEADSLKKLDENSVYQNPHFVSSANQSIYNQYPNILRVGQISSKHLKEQSMSDKKFKSSSHNTSSNNSSEESSGDSSGESSSDTNNSPSSSAQWKMPADNIQMSNLSQQSHNLKYDHGLFENNNNLYQGNQGLYDLAKESMYPIDPLLQRLISHNLMQHLMYSQGMERGEHAHFNSSHQVGCTLKCTCGLFNGQPSTSFQNRGGRSRANSDISMTNKSPQKGQGGLNIINNPQFHTNMQNIYTFQHLANQYPLGGFYGQMPHSQFGANAGAGGQQQHQNQPESNKIQIHQSEVKNSSKKLKKNKRALKRRQQEQLIKEEEEQNNINSVQKRRKISEEESEPIMYTPEVKGNQQSHNKREYKQSSKKIQVPLTSEKKSSTLKIEDNQHITPQKKTNVLNKTLQKNNSTTYQTQLKTMDTLKNSSNINDQHFAIEMTPNSLNNIEYNKFNSNTKEGIQHNLIEHKQYKQYHYTSHKDHQLLNDNESLDIQAKKGSTKGRGPGTAQKRQNLQNTGSKPTQSKISQHDKEQQIQKEEEELNHLTKMIIQETVSQVEFFAKVKENGVSQCLGCKCKNTKCLKLYCECLRNKATCGPECQCNQNDHEENACQNNEKHKKEREDAIRKILKSRRDAFDNKVRADQHFKGCKCAKSACRKKYCECFERSVACTANCKCVECKNGKPCGTHGEQPEQAVKKEESLFKEPIAKSTIQMASSSSFQTKIHQRQFELDQDLNLQSQGGLKSSLIDEIDDKQPLESYINHGDNNASTLHSNANMVGLEQYINGVSVDLAQRNPQEEPELMQQSLREANNKVQDHQQHHEGSIGQLHQPTMTHDNLTLQQPQITVSNIKGTASPAQKLNSNILEVIVDQTEENNKDLLMLEDPIDYNNNGTLMSNNTMGFGGNANSVTMMAPEEEKTTAIKDHQQQPVQQNASGATAAKAEGAVAVVSGVVLKKQSTSARSKKQNGNTTKGGNGQNAGAGHTATSAKLKKSVSKDKQKQSTTNKAATASVVEESAGRKQEADNIVIGIPEGLTRQNHSIGALNNQVAVGQISSLQVTNGKKSAGSTSNKTTTSKPQADNSTVGKSENAKKQMVTRQSNRIKLQQQTQQIEK